MAFNRTLGPILKIIKNQAAAQAKAQLIAAPTNGHLHVIGLIGYVNVAEAGKFLNIYEEDETTAPLIKISLAATGRIEPIFLGEEGIPITAAKDIQWECTSTGTADVDFTLLYRKNPPGG